MMDVASVLRACLGLPGAIHNPGADRRAARLDRSKLLAAATLGLTVLAAASSPQAVAPHLIVPAPLTAYSQEIPEAAFQFQMIPIPGDEQSGMKPFWISKTEITWEAFDVFIYRMDERDAPLPDGVDAVTRPSKPYLPPDRGFGHEGYAAIGMSHKTAAQFCKWLSARTGRTYRLPTEKEWEHACRAGNRHDFYCYGDDPSKLGDYAWFSDNAQQTPHPVATKQPNSWGIHDMHGNVAEWCDGEDGKPITRGGSYQDSAEKLKTNARVAPDAAWNASDPQIPKSQWWLANAPFVGFRIVCAPSDKET